MENGLINVFWGLFGTVWGPWVPGGIPAVKDPFGQGSLRSPKQIKIKYVFFYNILENNLLLFCRAINQIIVKGWLNFGVLWATPFAGLFFALLE